MQTKTRKLVVVTIMLLIMALATFMLVGCGDSSNSGTNGEKQIVKISGSSSVSPLMKKLAAEYENNNKNVEIRITTSDSSTGIKDTIDGKNDIGMASRALKTSENDVTGIKICDDGVVLIVKENVTLDNVTSEEVYNLYANGTAIGDILGAISREEGSGTRDAFDGIIKNSSGNALKELTTLSSAVDVQSSTSAVIVEISSNASKIGYISLGSLVSGNGVKGVKFNGVQANETNIKDGTYKLARPFNLVVKDENKLSDATKKFIEFIKSDAGQKVVKDNGYIAL